MDMKRVRQLDQELRDAKAKLVEYDREFSSLKNQEYTIRKLEQENKEYERKVCYLSFIDTCEPFLTHSQ
jgi:TolA-binding protein